jgi:hypothetical protein
LIDRQTDRQTDGYLTYLDHFSSFGWISTTHQVLGHPFCAEAPVEVYGPLPLEELGHDPATLGLFNFQKLPHPFLLEVSLKHSVYICVLGCSIGLCRVFGCFFPFNQPGIKKAVPNLARDHFR